MLHPFVAAADREPDALEDLGDLRPGLARRNPVEARGIREVFLGRHLLEKRRLDGHAVDEPLHGARFLDYVVAEDRGVAAVRQEQRRQHADQRRLPGAVLPQDRDAFATLDRERDALEGGYAASPLAHARAHGIAAEELLAQVVNFNGEHLLLLRLGGTRARATHRPKQAAPDML